MKEPLRSVTPYLDGYAKHDTTFTGALDGYQLKAFVAAGNVVSEPLKVNLSTSYSVVVTCPATGSPTGTLKLQGCIDLEGRGDGQSDMASLTNWFDVTAGGERIVTAAVTSAGGTFWLTDPECTYRWFRLVYTRSSGSITITVKASSKADS